MGRGRAKAKQTKVARELKYHSPNTDLAALQRELGGRDSARSRTPMTTTITSTSPIDADDDEDDDDDVRRRQLGDPRPVTAEPPARERPPAYSCYR